MARRRTADAAPRGATDARQGRTLAERGRRLLDGPAEALALAHAAGVLHRELSPRKLFVTRPSASARGAIKLLDFGTTMGDAPEDATYGAPERREETLGAAGPWSDVYALATIFLEMLAGRPAPSLTDIEVSARVSEVLERAVARRPAERQKDVGEFWGMLKGAILRDRDSLQRVSKLPLTAGSGAPMDRERCTLPEDMRITLSRIDGITVPRVDPDVIALSNAEISYGDARPLDSGVRSAPGPLEPPRDGVTDRPSNDTVVMTPNEPRPSTATTPGAREQHDGRARRRRAEPAGRSPGGATDVPARRSGV